MGLYKELCQKYLKDLQNGIIMAKKINGEWTEEKIPYEHTLKSYCKTEITKKVFLSMYKELPPIEEFPAEEKTEWKKYVNEIFPGTTPQFRMDAVRIIYTIGTLSS